MSRFISAAPQAATLRNVAKALWNTVNFSGAEQQNTTLRCVVLNARILNPRKFRGGEMRKLFQFCSELVKWLYSKIDNVKLLSLIDTCNPTAIKSDILGLQRHLRIVNFLLNCSGS